MPISTATRPTAVITAGMARATAGPWVSATTGMVNAHVPMPRGCAICRTPIAVPR